MKKLQTVSELQAAIEATNVANLALKMNKSQGIGSRGLPAGTIRLWAGQKFIKQGDGHWVPLPTQHGMQAQPQTQGSSAMAAQPQSQPAPQPEKQPEEKKPDLKVVPGGKDQPEKKETPHPTEHLKPKEGFGGHVELHSKDLEHTLKHGPTSIISAGRNPNNPEDRGLTDEQINQRYKRLEQDLKDKGYKYTKVKGHYGGEEESFMVHHADENHMNELGMKYNQDSVIHTKDGKNKLHFTTGDNAGKHHKGDGFQEVPDAEDYYSVVKTSDGQEKKFNLGLDFGKHYNSDE